MQLGVLGDARLDEERRLRRIDAGREPVDHHLPDVLLDHFRSVVMGGERVPVGDEEEARVLALKAHPVLKRPVEVPEVQVAGGAHARNDALRDHDQSVPSSGSWNAFAMSWIEPATIGYITTPSRLVNIRASRSGKPSGSSRA